MDDHRKTLGADKSSWAVGGGTIFGLGVGLIIAAVLPEFGRSRDTRGP